MQHFNGVKYELVGVWVAWYCVLYIGEFECPMCLAFTNRREKFAAVKSVVSQFLADDVFSFKLVVINVEDFFGLFSVKELSTFFSRPSEMRL